MLSRSVRFDNQIEAHAGNAARFVVLGTGLGTRAFGELANGKTAMFELDKATT